MSVRPVPSLRGNVGWALAGNLGYAACQWAILVVVAKLATAADVGRFTLALSLSAPAMIFSGLHLRAIQATDARDEHPFGVYLGLRLATTVAAVAGILLTAAALGYRGDVLALIAVVALAKTCEAVSDVAFGRLQQAERLRRIAASMLAKGVASVLAVALVLAAGGSLVAAAAAMGVVWATCLVAVDLPAVARLASLRPVLAPSTLAPLAGLALPMGCVMGLGSLTTNVPRYAIEARLGADGLGHFAAVAYLFVAGTQPMLALGAAVSPRLARAFVADRAAYRRLVRTMVASALAIGLAGLAVAAALGPAILTVAYAPAYAADAPLLVWLAVAGAVGFVSSALGYAVTAARRFREQLAVAVCALVACALASRTLVPTFGLVGAAWAVLATEMVRLACLGALYAHACAPPSARRAFALEEVLGVG